MAKEVRDWSRARALGTAQPGREGSTIFPEEYYPLIRVSSSLRSDEAPLAVSIFGVCQRLPLLTGDFAHDPVACVKAISRYLSTSTLLADADDGLHRRVVKTRNVQITIHTHGRQSAPTRTVRAPMVHHDVRRRAG